MASLARTVKDQEFILEDFAMTFETLTLLQKMADRSLILMQSYLLSIS